jgi:hypothetical protein
VILKYGIAGGGADFQPSRQASFLQKTVVERMPLFMGVKSQGKFFPVVSATRASADRAVTGRLIEYWSVGLGLSLPLSGGLKDSESIIQVDFDRGEATRRSTMDSVW